MSTKPIPNFKPQKNDVLEISRRTKSGQHPVFAFTGILANLLKGAPLLVLASNKEVRVNLVSRYDSVETPKHPKTKNFGSIALSKLLDLRYTGTWDEYSSVALRAPILVDKGDGWKAIVQPIEASDHSFSAERDDLTQRIDKVLDEPGSFWEPELPTLQVVEFKLHDQSHGDQDHAAAILDFVTAHAPQQTELFEAAVRFRPPVISS